MKLRICMLVLSLSTFSAYAQQGKLIGTSGITQVEGAGGGGLVPWATLAGYDTDDEISINGFGSFADLQDFSLASFGVSTSFYDRVELSLARHKFSIKAADVDIRQNVIGAKYRISGDVVYSRMPQISFGIQHKTLLDGDIAQALGANDNQSGTDVYVAATKVHLGAFAGYNLVWNATLRSSNANELGLLGFGAGDSKKRDLLFEFSAGVLLSRHLAVGFEYRQKPDNLALGEDDWKNVFVSYLPNKRVSFTLAHLELGSIAGSAPQSGLYLSIGGQFL